MTTTNTTDKMEPKEEYDDKGVLCRYLEDDGWYAIEDHCVDCGYRCFQCECDTDEAWVYPCAECGTHKEPDDLQCSKCLVEKDECGGCGEVFDKTAMKLCNVEDPINKGYWCKDCCEADD